MKQMPYKIFLNKNMRNNKGFTLIELLIVIAIIAMLSSIVLTSTKSSKNKGAAAAVKAGLQQIISQAENYYVENDESYGTTDDCSSEVFSDPVILKQIAEVNKRAKTGASSVQCYANDQSIAVSAILKGDEEKKWCIDNESGFLEDATAISEGICEEE